MAGSIALTRGPSARTTEALMNAELPPGQHAACAALAGLGACG